MHATKSKKALVFFLQNSTNISGILCAPAGNSTDRFLDAKRFSGHTSVIMEGTMASNGWKKRAPDTIVRCKQRPVLENSLSDTMACPERITCYIQWPVPSIAPVSNNGLFQAMTVFLNDIRLYMIHAFTQGLFQTARDLFKAASSPDSILVYTVAWCILIKFRINGVFV